MTSKNLEFIVIATEPREQFTLFGRCGDVPIHAGDQFDAVFRYRQRRNPDELGEPPVREVEQPASLRVACIHALEKSMKTMGEGMTGSLVIEGEGTQYIAPGWVLGSKGSLSRGGARSGFRDCSVLR